MVFPGDWEWSFLENYSAIEDQPYATKEQRLSTASTPSTSTTRPAGRPDGAGQEVARRRHPRDSPARASIPRSSSSSGKCSTFIAVDGGAHAAVERGAKSTGARPTCPGRRTAPAKNSTIGGAALWTLKGHKDEDYKGVAAFYDFLGNVEHAGLVAQATGYVPVTQAAYDAAKPGLLQGSPDPGNRHPADCRAAPRATIRRGFRLGNSAQANIAIKEEIQAGLLGQKPMQKAMDDAVARGNEVLRQFEKVNAGKY